MLADMAKITLASKFRHTTFVAVGSRKLAGQTACVNKNWIGWAEGNLDGRHLPTTCAPRTQKDISCHSMKCRTHYASGTWLAIISLAGFFLRA
jgi:hypothetical protein